MTPVRRVVVVIDGHTADRGLSVWSPLNALGDIRIYPRTFPHQVVERCSGAEAILTNKVGLNAEILAQLPALRYVGVTATGFNVVDVAACAARRIAVTNVPSYAGQSVAQFVLAMVLHFSQFVGEQGARVKAAEWAKSPDFCLWTRPMTEWAGKVVALFGHGAIGAATADLFRALGMEVVLVQVPGTPPRPDRTPLSEALPRAHIVSLHCPLTDATREMVNARFFDAMRPDALLINTSRGGLVDEAALAEALRAGKLGGVGLDVLQQEPPPADHPLLDPHAPFASRVLVTPHIAWATEEATTRLVDESIRNFEAWTRGERRNRVDKPS